jgi:uncharacterized membrane protein YjgN (DUF898 family)
MENNSPGDSSTKASSNYPPAPVHFTGDGSEYFGIWIVNLLLTIVTLGIYSPWAKVRRLKYFYRHTEIAGSSFDFHGSPIKILIGRVIALALLLAYNFSVRLHSPLILLVLLVLALVMPVLLRNSFRFRLYNTSWRGTRFHFRGSVAGAYRVFLLNGFLALITLYIMAPFMHHRLKAYQHNNSWFGRSQFSFHARAGQFYLIYLVLLAGALVVAVAFISSGIGSAFTAMVEAQKHGGQPDPRAMMRAFFILYGVLILVGLAIGPVFRALLANLIWNNTRLGEHRIECKMSALRLTWITLSNFALVFVTLGFYAPWALVRLRKYQLSCVTLLPATDLQEFQDAEPETVGAVGEEAATVFDFDISL